MKYFFKALIFLLVIFFSACSSKSEIRINDEMNSFSLAKKVMILSAPKTVPSPFSIGLGLGGNITRHVGINMGTVLRPDISNDEALDLERSVAIHNISLKNILRNEFSKQMKN